jgi:hypothetical protein
MERLPSVKYCKKDHFYFELQKFSLGALSPKGCLPTTAVNLFQKFICTYRPRHGLKNYKYTKSLMPSSLVLIEFIDWRVLSVTLVFSTDFVNYCPSNLLPPPPPRRVNKYTVYTLQCVRGGECGVIGGEGASDR